MLLNKKGLTLIEVLVALVITLVLFLALMQTALLSIDSNMKNLLRDEAVNIAEMRMNEARNLAFTETTDNLVSDTVSLAGADCPTGFSATGVLVERNFRNISDLDFCTNRTISCPESTPCPSSPTMKQIDITVGWRWKGENYTHSVSTIVRRQ